MDKTKLIEFIERTLKVLDFYSEQQPYNQKAKDFINSDLVLEIKEWI